MNRNKIIFSIIWFIIIFLLFLVFILIDKWVKKPNSKVSKDAFNIWIIWDDSSKFFGLIDDFKTKFPDYKNSNINITSFPNYEEYYNNLLFSFVNWNTPDIFSINNNDNNFFDKNIQWITSDIISTDEFRKNYDTVFAQDLIKQVNNWEKEKIELLAGIPLWYENLWIFYNFRDIKWKNLNNWSYINEAIRQTKEETWKVWIWIWNWSTVKYAEDIVTQFMLLDWISDLKSVKWDEIKSSLSNYARYWDENLENWYNKLFTQNSLSNKNNLNLFSEWEIQMVIWYPRMIQEIDKNWFNKIFLRAEAFPTYNWSWKLLINYNYLVINNKTKNLKLWFDLMKYFWSKDGQKKYLDTFPFYMPSMLSLVEDRLEKHILDWYSIKYKDFFNRNMELTSFNKALRVIYDKEILKILDGWVKDIDLFEILRKRILCISNKLITWNWYNISCEK